MARASAGRDDGGHHRPRCRDPSSPPPTSQPPGACQITYNMNAWNTGNVNGWALVFTLPSGQDITSGWHATLNGSNCSIG